MKTREITFALLATGVIGISGSSYAQKVDFGKLEYDSKCAICHGVKGKGDGHYAVRIKSGVPDLTTLSQRNKGGISLPADMRSYRWPRTLEGARHARHAHLG